MQANLHSGVQTYLIKIGLFCTLRQTLHSGVQTYLIKIGLFCTCSCTA